jgi:hypothetical protein
LLSLGQISGLESYGIKLYSSNITKVITFRMMRWIMCVIHTEEIKNAYKILVGKPEKRIVLGGVDWRRILKWISNKQGGRVWTGLIWFGIGTCVGHI